MLEPLPLWLWDCMFYFIFSSHSFYCISTKTAKLKPEFECNTSKLFKNNSWLICMSHRNKHSSSTKLKEQSQNWSILLGFLCLWALTHSLPLVLEFSTKSVYYNLNFWRQCDGWWMIRLVMISTFQLTESVCPHISPDVIFRWCLQAFLVDLRSSL